MTRAYTKAQEIMLQLGWVVVKGIPGSGKTSLALNILSSQHNRLVNNKKCRTKVLSSFYEVMTLNPEAEALTLILLDGVVERWDYLPGIIDDDLKMLTYLYNNHLNFQRDKRSVNAILTMSDHVWDLYHKDKLQHHPLMDNKHVIDLNSYNFKITYEEVLAMFKKKFSSCVEDIGEGILPSAVQSGIGPDDSNFELTVGDTVVLVDQKEKESTGPAKSANSADQNKSNINSKNMEFKESTESDDSNSNNKLDSTGSANLNQSELTVTLCEKESRESVDNINSGTSDSNLKIEEFGEHIEKSIVNEALTKTSDLEQCVISSDLVIETKALPTTDPQLNLDELTNHLIASENREIGFPEIIELFHKIDELTPKWKHFLLKPNECLSELFTEMYMCNDVEIRWQYCALLYLLFKGGEIHSARPTEPTLIKHLANVCRISGEEQIMSLLRKSKFVVNKQPDLLSFQHEVVMNQLFRHFVKYDSGVFSLYANPRQKQRLFTEECDPAMLLRYVRTHNSKRQSDKGILVTDNTDKLADRLAEYMPRDDDILHHVLLLNDSQFKKTFEKKRRAIQKQNTQ